MAAIESKLHDIEQYETVAPATATEQRPGYRASTPEDARLDRHVNLKMDLLIIVLLGAGFMVRLPTMIFHRMIMVWKHGIC